MEYSATTPHLIELKHLKMTLFKEKQLEIDYMLQNVSRNDLWELSYVSKSIIFKKSEPHTFFNTGENKIKIMK